MKIKIAKIILQTIEVSKCGKYCYEKRDGMERCGQFAGSKSPYCFEHNEDLKYKDGRPLRCQSCRDAEKLAREIDKR